MLHICLVTFIPFISYTKVHLFISCIKVQLIHFVIHFHLIHFTNNSPSHSHSPYLVLFILHRILTSLCLSFFNQSRLWKLAVFSDKILIRNISYQGGGISWCLFSLQEIKLFQQQLKNTQTQISNFSCFVQLYWISLFCSKYFFWHCSQLASFILLMIRQVLEQQYSYYIHILHQSISCFEHLFYFSSEFSTSYLDFSVF